MCKWEEIIIEQAIGERRIPRRIPISNKAVEDACTIIHRQAQAHETIVYSDLMNRLKQLQHRRITRGTIGGIVGGVSSQVSKITNPSVYPSAIVVRKDTGEPGDGFWKLDMGGNPPSKVTFSLREGQRNQYKKDVFKLNWSCNC